MAGLAQGAKKSRIDMCNVSLRLWAPKPAKTSYPLNGVFIRKPSSYGNPMLEANLNACDFAKHFIIRFNVLALLEDVVALTIPMFTI